MIKRLGILATGVVVGAIITGLVVTKEIQKQEENADPGRKKDGLFAEVNGSTVRLYKVEDGHFCGYHETREFESPEKAVEWVVKDTNAKLVMSGEQ